MQAGVIEGKGKVAEECGDSIGDGVVEDCKEEHQRFVQRLVVKSDTFEGEEGVEAGPGQVEGDEGGIVWKFGSQQQHHLISGIMVL